jgi:hypothetical protein
LSEQDRQNFIHTLHETMEIARDCGQLPAQGVLLTLLGAMKAGNDTELLHFLTEWNLRQVEMLTERITNQ